MVVSDVRVSVCCGSIPHSSAQIIGVLQSCHPPGLVDIRTMQLRKLPTSLQLQRLAISYELELFTLDTTAWGCILLCRILNLLPTWVFFSHNQRDVRASRIQNPEESRGAFPVDEELGVSVTFHYKRRIQ